MPEPPSHLLILLGLISVGTLAGLRDLLVIRCLVDSCKGAWWFGLGLEFGDHVLDKVFEGLKFGNDLGEGVEFGNSLLKITVEAVVHDAQDLGLRVGSRLALRTDLAALGEQGSLDLVLEEIPGFGFDLGSEGFLVESLELLFGLGDVGAR